MMLNLDFLSAALGKDGHLGQPDIGILVLPNQLYSPNDINSISKALSNLQKMLPRSKYAFLQQAFARNIRSRIKNRDFFFKGYRSNPKNTQRAFSSAVRRFTSQLTHSIPRFPIMNVFSYMMTADRGSFSKAKYLVVFCSSICRLNSDVSAPEISSLTRGEGNGNVEILFVNVNDFDQLQLLQQSTKSVSLMGLRYKTHYYTISQLGNIRNLVDS